MGGARVAALGGAAALLAAACGGHSTATPESPDSGTPDAGVPTTTPYAWALWPVPPDAPVSYTDNHDGTVTDEVTDLVWQQVIPARRFAWEDAAAYCAALSLPGAAWRLPSRIELISIVDYTRRSPAINPEFFPDTASADFWSSSFYKPGDILDWAVDFDDGHVRWAALGYQQGWVRCVRSPAPAPVPPAGRYSVGADTVVDVMTHLTWQRSIAHAGYLWPDGDAYCRGLTLGGLETGWRLPTIKELQTLIEEGASSPSLDADAFPEALPFGPSFSDQIFYWSSSPGARLIPRFYWVVDFVEGWNSFGQFQVSGLRDFQGLTRCIH